MQYMSTVVQITLTAFVLRLMKIAHAVQILRDTQNRGNNYRRKRNTDLEA